MKGINYNYPLQLQEVFKLHREVKTGDKHLNDDGDLVSGSEITYDEYTRLTYVLWEDIDTICGFPYEDNWENKGEKFFVESRGKQMLCLGSLEEILLNWTEFRALFGPHRFVPDEPITIMYQLKKQDDSGVVKD